VVKIKLERVAQKIIDLMADNRITLSDWKYTIPFYMSKQPDHILIIANNFAEGVKYQQERYGFEIPPEFVVAHPDDNMVVLNGKEYRGE
jgi:hypothetical protein